MRACDAAATACLQGDTCQHAACILASSPRGFCLQAYLDIVDSLYQGKQQFQSLAGHTEYDCVHLQDGQVTVSMAEANLSFSWEYAGNAAKLVVTSLTDRYLFFDMPGLHGLK